MGAEIPESLLEPQAKDGESLLLRQYSGLSESRGAHQGRHYSFDVSAGAAKPIRKKETAVTVLCDISSGSRLLPWPIIGTTTLLLGCVLAIFFYSYREDYSQPFLFQDPIATLTAQEHQTSVLAPELAAASQPAASRPFVYHNAALSPQANQNSTTGQQQAAEEPGLDGEASMEDLTNLCRGRLVYVYNISEAYNRVFVRECASFKKGRDLCMYMENQGMGRGFSFGSRLGGPPGVSEGAWYNTWQFALELYFHERLLRHPCVTENAELADVFFVPYYAGMDLSHRFTHRLARDELFLELGRWLQRQESWKRRGGRDHFMVLGRIAMDFHRLAEDYAWGNEMLLQKPFTDMVKLTIERHPTHQGNDNEIAIPYPTYFHASSDDQIRDLVDWLSKSSQRNALVTMAAGSRRPSNGMRYRLMTQCRDDPRCTLLLCEGHEASPGLSEEIANLSSQVELNGGTLNMSCNNPPILLGAMHRSQFCLQPPGDSPTRRSFFDVMLAGCIPVIFSTEAAWTQYVHHLPEVGESYSVYIPVREASKSNVIDILSKIPEPKITQMRKNIAKLLPSILYANVSRSYSPPTYVRPDAFDIALAAVLERNQHETQQNLNMTKTNVT